MTIGQSPRTRMKHDLLNKIVGREVGALSTGRLRYRLYQIIDLCAGDGQQREDAPDPSPCLLTRHAQFLQSRGGKVSSLFIEKNPATYRRLKEMLADSSAVDYRVIGSHSTDVPSSLLWENNPDYAFILNDPNSVTDWALTRSILNGAPKMTTTLSTLGCNVSGIKRLPLEEYRLGWFEHINNVIQFLPTHHDMMLVKLNRDAAQWAYLVTGPTSWFIKRRYQQDATKAFSNWKPGIEMHRLRQDVDKFHLCCRELFLTKAEL